MKKNILNWIEKLNSNERIPENIAALNFGLYEAEENYILYLSGSENYDENDDDWATEVDYEPKDKYINLPNSKNMDWKEILNEVEESIIEIINSNNFQNSIFTNIKNITVGFDDGDLIKIK